MNSRALLSLFGQFIELLDKKTPHYTRFKAEQETDLPLGTTVRGRVRPAKNEMTKIKRMKAPCPSQSSSPSSGKTYVGLTYVFFISSTTGPNNRLRCSSWGGQRAAVSMVFPSNVIPCQYQSEGIILCLLCGEEKYLEQLSSPAAQFLQVPVQAVRRWRVSPLLCPNFLTSRLRTSPRPIVIKWYNSDNFLWYDCLFY